MQHWISAKRYWRRKRKNAKNARQVRSALGKSLQHYVFEVLKRAMETGAPIKEVKESRTFSPADRKGWDIIIIDNEGVWHSFDVKSSIAGAAEFRRHGVERGLPSVPAIVFRLNDTPQQILDKVGEVLPFLRRFKLEKGDAE